MNIYPPVLYQGRFKSLQKWNIEGTSTSIRVVMDFVMFCWETPIRFVERKFKSNCFTFYVRVLFEGTTYNVHLLVTMFKICIFKCKA
jgi:hypothetical protein